MNIFAGDFALVAEGATDQQVIRNILLGFFADAGWVDPGLVPFVLFDELGRVADETLRYADLRHERGYVDALFYAGNRAWYVGDWERTQQVVSAGTEADPVRDDLEYVMEIVWGYCSSEAAIWETSLRNE